MGDARPRPRRSYAWAETAVPAQLRRGAPPDLYGPRRRSDGDHLGLLNAVTSAVADVAPTPVIASGGAGSTAHLVEAVREGGAAAVLAASIFHFGEATIGEVKWAMAEAGVPVRPIGPEVPQP